ncbi:DNA double-strand break repair nuclease NurA [Isachenkonia alkalipeptolytica]|uniref:NurA domain-containing protein n=1 Tax=Isachenkonia alkalipeptolytica TaxID=2565777 RepID=A0AA43XK64_9CLOT|nr:DNA double-strand break repair nuclease NurA [Isachenkonia alkalipeptolytica]NBG88132.1 hypothetical protein [Isachenkonia alkalipeptolytica]
MPYKGEYANKTSHFNILNSKDVQDFISDTNYLEKPSAEATEKISQQFIQIEGAEESKFPNKIVSVDGSYYESSIDQFLPSTKVGYIKIGSLLIDLDQYSNMGVEGTKFVDPFKVAKMQDNNSTATFTMPSANIIKKGKDSVVDSFRYYIDKHLLDCRMNESDYKTSLRSTLFELATYRPDSKNKDPNVIILHKCPNSDCDQENIELKDIEQEQFCPNPECGIELYPSDALRIWEEVKNYQSNGSAISRFMIVLEHLMPIFLIRHIKNYHSENSLATLQNLSFVIDGPLAIFGTAAWLSRAIMQYLWKINEEQLNAGFGPLLYLGLQKTGQLMDFMYVINNHVEDNRLLLVDDALRYKYVAFSRNPSKSGFGYETYYGQDFMYKSKTGRSFVFSLPFPFKEKDVTGEYNKNRQKLENYKTLNSAISFIDHFECDLFENAVVPIALAHRYTAISLKPGAQALDILTKNMVSETIQNGS